MNPNEFTRLIEEQPNQFWAIADLEGAGDRPYGPFPSREAAQEWSKEFILQHFHPCPWISDTGERVENEHAKVLITDQMPSGTVHDPDPDEGADEEDTECHDCRGTGIGLHDGASCGCCGGSGQMPRGRSEDDYDDDRSDDRDEAAEWGGMDGY